MLVFLFLRPYNSSKLQFKSDKYVFLGYSPFCKGYMCLYKSGRIYISDTVEFHEFEFPFESFNKSSHITPSFSTTTDIPSFPPTFTSSSSSPPTSPPSYHTPVFPSTYSPLHTSYITNELRELQASHSSSNHHTFFPPLILHPLSSNFPSSSCSQSTSYGYQN